MKIQTSSEQYLEAILMLQKRNPPVRSIDIANELGFTKPSISIAIKRLRENGFLEVGDHGYITLTEKGHEIASSLYDRHCMLTSFFKHIGVEASVAEADACRIEHVLSDESFHKFKEFYRKLNPEY